MIPPVLFLIFNRPEPTKQVFSQIRRARPKQLFIAADGPRPDVEEDVEFCAQTRAIVDLVDWDCEVRTLFRQKNLGLKSAVSSAINWFFEQVPEGIILEDDCLPHLSFFDYCKNLLEKYRDEHRVLTLSGDKILPDSFQLSTSYYFSRFPSVWGWATWQRAWQLYDVNMTDWPALRDTPWLYNYLNNKSLARYWQEMFDEVYRGNINSWAYPLVFASWLHDGLAIRPAKNLISNIGYGEAATNTQTKNSSRANLPVYQFDSSIVHPSRIERNRQADEQTAEAILGINQISLPRKVLKRTRKFVRRFLARN